MSVVLVLCVAVCTYVTELQFGLSATLGSQAKTITQGTSDQVWAAVFNEPSSQYLVDSIAELTSVSGVAAQRVPTVAGPWENGTDTVLHDKPCFEYIPVQPNYFSVKGAGLAAGRYFRPGESGRVAVIGSEVAERRGWSLGSTVRSIAAKEQYTVIGILAPGEADINLKGNQRCLGMDSSVFVPFVPTN